MIEVILELFPRWQTMYQLSLLALSIIPPSLTLAGQKFGAYRYHASFGSARETSG